MDFSKMLIKWYLGHKRDLPWRKTVNPYLIWLSEIMLQQTRVAQGLPYYLSFTNAFPTVFDLANANQEQVLKLWQGLGYYSRARNLHETAQIVAFEMNGIFPNNYKDLLNLKGIGDYTAAAIASFSYNEVVPVVDGNVFRVLSRYFDVENDISLNSTKKIFANLALELIPKNNPAIFNQAIMEFGALQCIPKNPNCNICPFNESCAALQKNKIDQLPVKSKKIKVTNRYFNYIIYNDKNNKTLIQKRTLKDIWQNLYEFPLIETQNLVSPDFVTENLNDNFSIIAIYKLNNKEIVHKLTHQKLHINFWRIDIDDVLKESLEFHEIKTFPLPIVIANFVEKEYKKFN
jgi:A/G-specific adenine glycosylase